MYKCIIVQLSSRCQCLRRITLSRCRMYQQRQKLVHREEKTVHGIGPPQIVQAPWQAIGKN